jgi:hypothetical protein
MTEPTEHRCRFHNLNVSIKGSRAILSTLESRLAQLPAANEDAVDLAFTFEVSKTIGEHRVVRPRSEGRSFYAPLVGEATYFPDEDLLYLDYDGRVRALCNPAEGRCALSLLDPEDDQLWLATHPLFTIPLIEMLKRRGKFNVHAAGFGVNGRSVLLPGTTGAGKSTLTIALLRGGLDLLGDDMAFLEEEQSGELRTLAFPENIDITDGTAGFFEELRPLLDQVKHPGWPKHEIRPAEYFQSRIAWKSRPAAIVFPQISQHFESTLEPMDSDAAFLELAPNVLLTDAVSTRAHFEMLARLVRSVPSYRLNTGRDFDRIPQMVRELLEEPDSRS